MSDVRFCLATWKDAAAEVPLTASPKMELLSMMGAMALAQSARFGGPAEVELHSALAVALTEPRAEQRWMAGEDLFDPARVTSRESEKEFVDALEMVAQKNGMRLER